MAMTLEERLRLRAVEEQCADLHKRFDVLNGLVQATLAELERQTTMMLGHAFARDEPAAEPAPDVEGTAPGEPSVVQATEMHLEVATGLASEVALAQLRVDMARELAGLSLERQREAVARIYHRKEARTLASGLAALILAVAALSKVKVTADSVLAMIAGLTIAFGLFWHILERTHREERRVKAALSPPIAEPEKPEPIEAEAAA